MLVVGIRALNSRSWFRLGLGSCGLFPLCPAFLQPHQAALLSSPFNEKWKFQPREQDPVLLPVNSLGCGHWSQRYGFCIHTSFLVVRGEKIWLGWLWNIFLPRCTEWQWRELMAVQRKHLESPTYFIGWSQLCAKCVSQYLTPNCPTYNFFYG